jgi:hypothetical protein
MKMNAALARVVAIGDRMMSGRLRRRFLLFVVLVMAGSALTAPRAALAADDAPADEPHPTPGIEMLGWLAGHWAGESNGIAMEEHWTTADGNALVGMHKDVKDGRMVSFEFFRVAPGPGGRTTYFTSPGGRPAVAFTAIEITDTRVVFENRQHDFPQRILYWLGEGGRLHARIEGTMNGKTASEEWSWARVTGP